MQDYDDVLRQIALYDIFKREMEEKGVDKKEIPFLYFLQREEEDDGS